MWPAVFELMVKYFKPTSIADLGCGEHRWSWSDATIVGFDNRKIPWVIYSDFNNQIDISNNSTDYSLAIEVIEHLENPLHFLREIKRITRKRFIISHPDRANGTAFYTENTYDSMAHISIISAWLMRKHFERLGLKLLETRHVRHGQMAIHVVDV